MFENRKTQQLKVFAFDSTLRSTRYLLFCDDLCREKVKMNLYFQQLQVDSFQTPYLLLPQPCCTFCVSLKPFLLFYSQWNNQFPSTVMEWNETLYHPSQWITSPQCLQLLLLSHKQRTIDSRQWTIPGFSHILINYFFYTWEGACKVKSVKMWIWSF